MSIRSLLAGACAASSAFATGLGALAWSTPTATAIGPLVRIFDSLSPGLMIVGAGFAVLAGLLGARRLGIGLAGLAAICSAVGVMSYRAVTVPLAAAEPSDFSVLFFNVENTNTAFSARIIDAVLAEAPDIAVFAEAEALIADVPRLQEAYAFVSPCEPETCQLVVASNMLVRRSWFLSLNPIWPKRYAVLEVETLSGDPVFVVANHLTKPWMSGVSEAELAQLQAQYDWLKGPTVIVGDFNMTPWSRPLRHNLEETEFRALRGQPASWPASGGPLALPIDLALVKGGARATAVEAFGQGLNSNHLGFVVDIAVPTQGD